MSIIRSSKKFEGGEFKTQGTRYLKSSAKLMNFYDRKLVDGAYVFILGAYKEDSAGNGVWYKAFKIRDNFGMDTKEKFAVGPNCPIDYFANKVKIHAPHLAKVEKVKGEDGRDRNVYPAFGRTTWRVIYNAAFFADLEAGVHLLDLPASGGASAIDDFVNGKGPGGEENPDITDPQAAYPVNIKLDLKATGGGQPWKIQVNNSKAYALPNTLADTDFLYNLDDVIVYPGKQELVEKLKLITPPDIFAKCMAGYSDGSVVVSMATPALIAASGPPPIEDDLNYGPPPAKAKAAPAPAAPRPSAPRPAAPVAVAPAFSMPKPTSISATRPTRAPAPVVEPTPEVEAPVEEGAAEVAEVPDDMPRPSAPTTAGSPIDMAKAFLRRPSAA